MRIYEGRSGVSIVKSTLFILLGSVFTSYGELVLPDPGGDNRVGISTNTAVPDEVVQPKNEPLKLMFELDDGTRVIGVPVIETLPFKTSFADIKLSLKLIDSIEFSKESGSARVLFGNGDKLEGSLKVEEIAVETLFGKHSIPIKHVVAMAVTAGGAGGAMPKEGLVLYFSFDKDENGVVKDKSGSGNDGTVNGAKLVSNGKRGGAYEFNGHDSYIQSARSPGVTGRQPWSISFWVKVFSSQGAHDTMVSIGKAYHSHGIVGVGTGSANPKELAMNLWGPNYGVDTGVDNTRGFMNVITTYDGKALKSYVNGAEKKSCEIALNIVEHQVMVGGRNGGYSGHYLNGILDEVMIYNRALSDKEVKQLYNSQR